MASVYPPVPDTCRSGQRPALISPRVFPPQPMLSSAYSSTNTVKKLSGTLIVSAATALTLAIRSFFIARSISWVWIVMTGILISLLLIW